MPMGASEGSLADSSPGHPGAAGRMEWPSLATQIPVEVLPEDPTHAVQGDGVYARVEETGGIKEKNHSDTNNTI